MILTKFPIDSSLPGHVQLHRRKDFVYLRGQQRDYHPHGVGSVPREQPAHPGGHGSTLRRQDVLGRGEDFARLKAENPGMMDIASRKNSVLDPETGNVIPVDAVTAAKLDNAAAEHVDRL